MAKDGNNTGGSSAINKLRKMNLVKEQVGDTPTKGESEGTQDKPEVEASKAEEPKAEKPEEVKPEDSNADEPKAEKPEEVKPEPKKPEKNKPEGKKPTKKETEESPKGEGVLDFEFILADHDEFIGRNKNVSMDELIHGTLVDLSNGLNVGIGKLSSNVFYYLFTHHMDEFKAEMKRQSKTRVVQKKTSLL